MVSWSSIIGILLSDALTVTCGVPPAASVSFCGIKATTTAVVKKIPPNVVRIAFFILLLSFLFPFLVLLISSPPYVRLSHNSAFYLKYLNRLNIRFPRILCKNDYITLQLFSPLPQSVRYFADNHKLIKSATDRRIAQQRRYHSTKSLPSHPYKN